METISKQLWAMQRFGLVKSFANAPPLPFPYVVIWPFYSVFRLFSRLLRHQSPNDTPFCKSICQLIRLGYELEEGRLRQIINWQKFRCLDYLNRHPNAYRNQKVLARYGKSNKKVWWLETEEMESSNDTHIATIGSQLANNFMENRLQSIEMRLTTFNAEDSISAPSETVSVRKLLLISL